MRISGGIPKYIKLESNNCFKLDVKILNKFLTKKTKAIIINSPNNPAGVVYSEENLIKIAKFAKKNNLIIISDEIYEKLIYENNKHISIASVSQKKCIEKGLNRMNEFIEKYINY